DVRSARVRVGVDRDALDAELAAGADDANRDLAAVRHQQAPDHRAHPLRPLLPSVSLSSIQPGLRFSTHARSPSCPSAETRRSAIAAAVTAIASPTLRNHTSGMRALAAATA